MTDPTEVVTKPTPTPSSTPPAAKPWFRPWAFATAILVILFAIPLYRWLRFGIGSSVFSHVLLIPLVSGYLAWNRKAPDTAHGERASGWPVAFAVACIGVLVGYAAVVGIRGALPTQDAIAIEIFAFVLGFAAVCAWRLPRSILRGYAFPIGFLILMVPFPTFLHRALETALQHGSADAAYAMLRMVDTPVLREGLVFHIPGISLEVAPQCSGIRSTLALFVTSIVAGYLFLRSPWKRALLTAFVIPLAIIRNGFRVFTIAELCVRYGPEMVHTPIHHQGGPIFFALSLIPFSLLLLWLYRSEKAEKLKS